MSKRTGKIQSTRVQSLTPGYLYRMQSLQSQVATLLLNLSFVSAADGECVPGNKCPAFLRVLIANSCNASRHTLKS